MAQRTYKIEDVKRPDKVTPPATSRHLLISNQSTVSSDPMVVSSDDDKKDDEIPMTHSAKEIKPLDPNLKPEPDEEETQEAAPDASQAAETEAVSESSAKEPKEEDESEPKVAEEDEHKSESEETEKPESDKSDDEASKDSVSDGGLSSVGDRDPEAAMSAEETVAEEVKTQREQELEKLIASGKYEVPINAVQRKRSRIATTVLFIMALALAAVLFDVAADVGVIKVPNSIPHTHYFSK